jgi:hypothetical protein
MGTSHDALRHLIDHWVHVRTAQKEERERGRGGRREREMWDCVGRKRTEKTEKRERQRLVHLTHSPPSSFHFKKERARDEGHNNVLIIYEPLHTQRYDWNEAQRKLGQFSHYKMPVQDLNVHFIHEVRTSERRLFQRRPIHLNKALGLAQQVRRGV